jgi:Tfp pilus assembly protein PilV
MPKPDVVLNLLVMIRTFSARLRVLGRSSIGRRSLGSERGDTIIEVIVSALLLGLVVVGTLTGLNSANRATSIDRQRSQADALAQQDEDRLRSEPVSKLSELSASHEAVVHEVSAGGTKYTITSTAKYIADTTATSSCKSTTSEADYIQTASAVTWSELGTGKPVVETSIVSPPPASALIVQVVNQKGEVVPGMSVVATGPSPVSTVTSTNGCAVLAVLPGEYKLNVSKPGYVDQNGYAESEKDPVTDSPFYVVAETSVKKEYIFAEAGALQVKFENPVTKTTLTESGDSFVVANANTKPTYKTFPFPETLGTYQKEITSPATLFPFTNAKYSVYAGTCEEDNPHVVNPENPEPTAVLVPAGHTETATVAQPPINVRVMSGKSSIEPGKAIETATVTLTDDGCHTKRESKTNAKGELSHPGAPFGEYTLCVTGGKEGGNNGTTKGLAKDKKYTATFENNTPTGPSTTELKKLGTIVEELKINYAAIYMEGSGNPGELKAGESCP